LALAAAVLETTLHSLLLQQPVVAVQAQMAVPVAVVSVADQAVALAILQLYIRLKEITAALAVLVLLQIIPAEVAEAAVHQP
jgi:hypothetical protein